MLTVSVQNRNGVTVLKCRGRIVRGEEQSLLCAAVRVPDNLAIDLSEVEAIDAAGIGLLISLQAAGVYLTLLNPSDAVLEVLRITGVDSLFAIMPATGEPAASAPFGLEPALPACAPVPLAS